MQGGGRRGGSVGLVLAERHGSLACLTLLREGLCGPHPLPAPAHPAAVALFTSDVRAVPAALMLAHAAGRTIVLNIVFSVATKVRLCCICMRTEQHKFALAVMLDVLFSVATQVCLRCDSCGAPACSCTGAMMAVLAPLHSRNAAPLCVHHFKWRCRCPPLLASSRFYSPVFSFWHLSHHMLIFPLQQVARVPALMGEATL